MAMVELSVDTYWVGTATVPNLISNATVTNLKEDIKVSHAVH